MNKTLCCSVVEIFHSFCSDASVTGLDGINTTAIFYSNFHCNGDEARLTDCVATRINKDICGNRTVGLVCETGITFTSKILNLICYNSTHRRHNAC